VLALESGSQLDAEGWVAERGSCVTIKKYFPPIA
jgi:hypothetical protein